MRQYVMWFMVAASCASNGDPGTSIAIDPSVGGVLMLNDELLLTVAPGTMATNAQLTVRRIDDFPRDGVDDFIPFGQGYRFLPAGTSFDLTKPARLNLRVDVAALAARGLDARTVALFYFDEEARRYLHVRGSFDSGSQRLTADLEHFTVYVPMAQALIPGNMPPSVVTLQAPVPSAIRAGAPIAMRATVRDHTQGGSIASVVLRLRRLQSNTTFDIVMRPDPATADTFVATVPASILPPSELGAGSDLEYWVEATDNLGAARSSNSAVVDVTRVYAPGTLALTPTTHALAAGYQRVFAVTANDNLGTSFPLIPDRASGDTGGVAVVEAPSPTGVLVTGTRIGMGTVTVGFTPPAEIAEPQSATALLVVYPGPIDAIRILDEAGDAIAQSTLLLREGHVYSFDALGIDIAGNDILVNPTWSLEHEVGYFVGAIGAEGTLDTLDADGFGRVVATVGQTTAKQWIDVRRRTWELVGGAVNTNPPGEATIAADGNEAWVAWTEPGVLRVARWDGSVWQWAGGHLNAGVGVPIFPAIAIVAGVPYVAFNENAGIYVKRWNGTDWMLVGARLNVDSSFQPPSIVDVGGAPHVVFVETEIPGLQPSRAFVRRFDGTAWQQLGGALNLLAHEVTLSAELTAHDGRPCVSTVQHTPAAFNYVVSCWDGATWNPIGGPVNNLSVSAGSYGLHSLVGEPELMLAFLDGDTVMRVKRWTGSAWVQDGSLAFTPAPHDLYSLAAAHSGSALYVVWADSHTGPTDVQMAHVRPGWVVNDSQAAFNLRATRGPATLAISKHTQWTTVIRDNFLLVYRLP